MQTFLYISVHVEELVGSQIEVRCFFQLRKKPQSFERNKFFLMHMREALTRNLLHADIHQDCSTSKIKGTKLNREGNKLFPCTHAHTDLPAQAWKAYFYYYQIQKSICPCAHTCIRDMQHKQPRTLPGTTTMVKENTISE